jgi:hypothetical protein
MNNETRITSIKDDRVIEARSLQTPSGRFSAQKFLLEGTEQILWSFGGPCRLQHVFISVSENLVQLKNVKISSTKK